MLTYLLSRFLLSLGILLLLLQTYGLFAPPDTRSVPELIPGRHFRVIEPDTAIQDFNELKETNPALNTDTAQRVFQLISDSFLHYRSRYFVRPYDSWILWIADQMHYRRTGRRYPVTDLNLLWRRGGGFCSQASLLYVGKVQELGFQARRVSNQHHVIAEVFVPSLGWHAVGSRSLEYSGGKDLGTLRRDLTHADIQKALEAKGYPPDYNAYAARVYLDMDWYVRGERYMESLREREHDLLIYSWLLPALLIIAGVLLHRRNRRSSSPLTL